MLNLDSSWLTADINLIHAGPIAEQFIAQHLFYWHGSFVPPSLNYWSRDGKSASAEVDFAVQYEGAIIPIEVKSGKPELPLYQFIWWASLNEFWLRCDCENLPRN